jgi:mannosyltransferase
VTPARALIARAGAAARWPAIVFILALIPRLIDLGTRPFWLDEVFTFQRAHLPPAALVQDSFFNHHMPSFFLLLAPFAALGHPQFWLRAPSAIFGAISVMMVFIIGRRIGGRMAGIIAALVLGLSPTALAFSQEARSYTMEMSLILIALYGIVRLALDLPAAAAPLRRRAAVTGWLAFTLGSAAALDVLGDGMPWLITANIIFVVLVRQSPRPRQMLANLLIADAAVAILTAPFYIAMLFFQDKGFVDSVMWIPALTLPRFWYDVGSVYLMRIPDSVTFKFMSVRTPELLIEFIEAGLLIAVAAATWRLRRRPAVFATLLVSFLFLPLLFTVVSIWRPILLPRYILWSAAPFAILAGIGASALLTHFRPRLRLSLLGAGAALLLINMAPYYHVETKPRWDVAAKMLALDVQPGDTVLLYDQGALPILKLYLPAGVKATVLHNVVGNVADAQTSLAQGKRVWAVFGHAGQNGGSQQWVNFYNKNEALGTPRQIQVAGNRIYIALYNPPSLACLAPSAVAGCS